MEVQLTWAGVGIIIAILIHAYHTVVWSSRITIHLENLGKSIDRVDKELEKRDIQIAAAWRKIDGFSERLVRVEVVNGKD